MRILTRSSILFAALSLLQVGAIRAAVICVDPSSPGCEATIQAGINLAAANDTVDIAAGTYFETISISTNGIILQGAGSSKTIIDAGDSGLDVVTLNADSVRIKGLGIRNGLTGVVANATGLTIESVAFQGLSGRGIEFNGQNLVVSSSNFRGCYEEGIYAHGGGTTVTKSIFRHIGNAAVENYGDGMVASGNTFQLVEGAIEGVGDRAQISANKINDSDGAGINWNCDPCTSGLIAKNKIEDLADDSAGISVHALGTGMVIEGNSIARTNDEGIGAEGSGITVHKNKVKSAGGDNYESCFEFAGEIVATKNKASICAQYGFDLGASGPGLQLTDNSASKAFAGGFFLNGDSISMAGNKSKKNSGVGFQVSSASTNMVLTKNKASKNQLDLCDLGSMTTLTDNTFATTQTMNCDLY